MRLFLAVVAILLAAANAGFAQNNVSKQPQRFASIMCFKTGERISGMNKICYYNCLGSEAAITISSIDLCPLSIEQ